MRRRAKKIPKGYVGCKVRSWNNKKKIRENVERLIEATLLAFPKVTRHDLLSPARNLEAAAARSIIYATLYFVVLDGQGMPDIAQYFKFSKVTVWNGIKRAQQAASSEKIDWYGRRLRIMATATQVSIQKFNK